jgi:hypothetical protein
MKIEIKIILEYDDFEFPFDRAEKNELLKLLDVYVSNNETPALGDFVKPDESYEINIVEE